ncbi:MAG: fold metallo-hydrolase, partial [Gaiellaceae bacterium]|nr:fold metallo-hydrolase [Gaiellaceae bacterium]
DAAGVRIQPAETVLPPTPPPDVDLEAWERTLREIERRRPEQLALIHFGVAADVERHLGELRERLATWAARVERGAGEDEFVAAAKADLPAADAESYDRAMPFWQSYAGLARYWEQRRA